VNARGPLGWLASTSKSGERISPVGPVSVGRIDPQVLRFCHPKPCQAK
jgi:hypothetical protein